MSKTEGEDKVITLEEAVGKVHDGAHLFWGGFGVQRPPMAFAHELVRQRKRNLTLYTCGSEIDFDILAGAGVAKRFEVAYFALEVHGLAPNLRRRAKEGLVEIEDYSNLAMAMRFLGGALGVPFMPIKTMLGTDLIKKYRFRKDKAKVIDCPFTGEKVCLVPSANPDFSVIHVQRADREGNSQIDGIKGEDVEGARAGKKVIVLAEQIVSSELTRSHPDLNAIPGIYVDYVAECAWGSYPMMVYNCYDYDIEHIRMYIQQCKTEEGWRNYLQEWILNVDYKGFLKKIGMDRMLKLRARPGYGY